MTKMTKKTKKTATKPSWTFLTMKKQRKWGQTTALRRTVTLQPPSASAHCCRSGMAATSFSTVKQQIYSLRSDDNKKESAGSRRFSKLCLKNFFTVVLILIYLLLTAVAAFLAYQTISEVLEKLKNPVMSVTYQEVDSFPRPGLYRQRKLARLWLQQDPLLSFLTCAGIALYPGNAQLLGCSHYYHNDIPPLVDPGRPQEIDCVVTEVTYVWPFSSKVEVSLLKKKTKTKQNSTDWWTVGYIFYRLTDRNEL